VGGKGSRARLIAEAFGACVSPAEPRFVADQLQRSGRDENGFYNITEDFGGLRFFLDVMTITSAKWRDLGHIGGRFFGFKIGMFEGGSYGNRTS
jgi:hypothetical protein